MRTFLATVAVGASLTGPARAQAPAPPVAPSRAPSVVPPPAQSVEGYAEVAATTIIAERSCPGLRLDAG